MYESQNTFSWIKQPDKRKYILHDSIYMKFQNMQTSLWWPEADQWSRTVPLARWRGLGREPREVVITQGHRETCGSSGYVHNLYFGGTFLMCTHMSQLVKLYILNMCKLCNLLYVNYISVKPRTSLSGMAQLVELPAIHQRVAGSIPG